METQLALLAVLLATSLGHAHAAGDAKRGADTFAEECGDCHSLSPGKNKKGPTLHGINGRRSGTIGDFAGYSDAIRQAGITWSPEQIDAYITHPRKVVPAGKMKYDGLADASARADIVAYLMSVR